MANVEDIGINSKEVEQLNKSVQTLIKSSGKLFNAFKNVETVGNMVKESLLNTVPNVKALNGSLGALSASLVKECADMLSNVNSATLLSGSFSQALSDAGLLELGIGKVNDMLSAVGLNMDVNSVATSLLSGNYRQALADSGLLEMGLSKVNDMLGLTGLSMDVNSVATNLLSGEYRKAFEESGLLESALQLVSEKAETVGLKFDAASMASELMQGNFMGAVMQSGLLDSAVATLAEKLDIGGGTIKNVNDLLGWLIDKIIGVVAESGALEVIMNAIGEVMKIVGSVVEWVADNFDILAPIIMAVVTAIGAYNAIMAICNIVSAPINATILAIVAAVGALIAIVALVVKHWEPIKDFFKNLWDGICNTFRTAINFVIGGLNSFIGFINNLIGKALGGINSIIKAANKVPFINIPLIPVEKLQIPQIPMLANGGIVSGATMAVIGEGKYREAVVPLGASPEFSSMKADIANAVVQAIMLANRSMAQQKTTSVSSSGETLVLNIDGQTLAKMILPRLKKEAQRFGYNLLLQEV